MSCSSNQCPETSLRIHSECYDKLEKLLVQAAAGNARCRNWSENQIRMNLWNRKVYDILFRLLACKCGHGYLKLEEEIILPPPKPLQLKKTAAKAQLKPELKDAKLKKAKKLSSKSAMSESFKRHQEAKKETGGADGNTVSFEVEVINSVAYIPGLATTAVKSKKKSRKSSLENDTSITSPVTLNPGVRSFIPRNSSVESDPDSSELFYSSNDEEEEEEERQEEWGAGGCEFRERSLSHGSSNNVIIGTSGREKNGVWAPTPGDYRPTTGSGVPSQPISLLEQAKSLLEQEKGREENWRSSSIFEDPAVLSSGFLEADLRELESNTELEDKRQLEADEEMDNKHADSLIESLEVLLNTDMEKSSKLKEAEQKGTETNNQQSLLSCQNDGKDQKEEISSSSVINTTEKVNPVDCGFEPRVKSGEKPRRGPKHALEDIDEDPPTKIRDDPPTKTDEDPSTEIYKQQQHLSDPAPQPQKKPAQVVLTPQWKKETKSETNNDCFSCDMFPKPQVLAEVRRKENPRHRRRAGECCRQCEATINGQADFLKFYQERNGPFEKEPKNAQAKIISEPNVVPSSSSSDNTSQDPERDKNIELGENVISSPSAQTPVIPNEHVDTILEQTNVNTDLAQIIAKLKRELFDARVKQIAYLALNLALENMTPIVCSN